MQKGCKHLQCLILVRKWLNHCNPSPPCMSSPVQWPFVCEGGRRLLFTSIKVFCRVNSVDLLTHIGLHVIGNSVPISTLVYFPGLWNWWTKELLLLVYSCYIFPIDSINWRVNMFMIRYFHKRHQRQSRGHSQCIGLFGIIIILIMWHNAWANPLITVVTWHTFSSSEEKEDLFHLLEGR